MVNSLFDVMSRLRGKIHSTVLLRVCLLRGHLISHTEVATGFSPYQPTQVDGHVGIYQIGRQVSNGVCYEQYRAVDDAGMDGIVS